LKSNTDSVRLLGAVTLALNSDCTMESLLDAILKWRPFERMVKRESKNRV
jgi:hypothetical protein